MMRRMVATLIASQMMAAPLMAATLVPSAGRVSVDTGRGLRVVSRSVTVKPGDRVVVGLGGAASIQYGAGCSTPVPPGEAVAVAPGIPCAAPGPNAPVAPGVLGGLPLGGLIGGGALIGGIAAAAAFAGSNGNGPVLQPISP